jgi:energy-coupling factor transporter ATP-binding protein EcfA2
MATPANPTPSTNRDSFEIWLGERHKWLQTAARRLIDAKRPLRTEEIEKLVDLCIDEAGDGKPGDYESPVPGSLAQASAQPALSIRELADVHGVNAIKNGASISFGATNLSVVYGPNGSGKTGFSRLLKQMCGSRARDGLYGNVFVQAKTPIHARVRLSLGDKEEVVDWSPTTGALGTLRHVHVFDSRTAAMYMGQENPATYEPSRMRFVSSLIKICDEAAMLIESRKQKLVKALALTPDEIATTSAAKWIQSLSATTSQQSIDAACEYTADLDGERVAAETALAQKDTAGRLKQIEAAKKTLANVRSNIETLTQGLCDETLSALVSKRHDAANKRKAATDYAAMVFGNAPVDGIGQESWLHLWSAARKFSEAHAYPGAAFPHTDNGARCVLCQQPLLQDGKDRLHQFESYVQGELEHSAKTAEEAFATVVGALPAVPLASDWRVQCAVIKISEAEADAMLTRLSERRAAADTASRLLDLPSFDWSPLILAADGALSELESEEKALLTLQQDGKRKELETRVLELKGLQWLSQQKKAITDEVSRLAAVAVLDKATTLTNTAALTRKHTELASIELDTGYQTRFAAELKTLGGQRLAVKPTSKQQGKGKITFGLTLRGAKHSVPTEKVLSEGELRIVALAAFLADMTGSEQPTPFVFDDPISSLDQDFEERVVARLTELAKARQVIVFTHRLSLLTLIDEGVKKIKEQATLQKAPTPVDLHVETLRRLGPTSGLTTQFGIRDSKPKTAVNRMRNESIPQLRKLYSEGDVSSYEERAKGVCSDLRILVERSVEHVLLNEVLVRFRRSVQTQNRIGALAKITVNDCTFIDDLMTRYSTFEHSQPEELPAALPDLDMLEVDLKALAEWIDEFGKRPVS